MHPIFEQALSPFFPQTKTNTMQSTATKKFYLTSEEFDRDLDTCLIIIHEPTHRQPYYVCEYTSPALYKSIVHVYIKK